MRQQLFQFYSWFYILQSLPSCNSSSSSSSSISTVTDTSALYYLFCVTFKSSLHSIRDWKPSHIVLILISVSISLSIYLSLLAFPLDYRTIPILQIVFQLHFASSSFHRWTNNSTKLTNKSYILWMTMKFS